MDMKNYQRLAQRTKSPNFHGHLVPKHLFIANMQAAISVLQQLDKIKKALFYGLEAIFSDFEQAGGINIDKLVARFPDKFSDENANNRDLTAERQVLEQLPHHPV